MVVFDWESLNKDALLKTLKLYRPDDPPKATTSKDGLIGEAKAFLIENPGRIDEFFRRVAEVKAEKPEKKPKADEVEGEGA